MRFALRDFKPGDFNRLYEMDRACFPPGIAYSRRELAYYIKVRGAFTMVAEEEKSHDIAGFLVASRSAKGLGHVITIDTLEKYRRYGLGSLLMTEAEHRLHAHGCHAVFLEVAVDNQSAIKFYKKLGYSVLKTLHGYYHNELDAFLMAKRFEKAVAQR